MLQFPHNMKKGDWEENQRPLEINQEGRRILPLLPSKATWHSPVHKDIRIFKGSPQFTQVHHCRKPKPKDCHQRVL